MARTVHVWDLPTRVFHWALFVTVTGALITAQFDELMVWHFLFGESTLALLVFRLIWGFVGPRYARFSSFVASPAAVLRYAGHLLSKAKESILGHNPLGGISVFLILLLLLFQACTGLLSNTHHHKEFGPLAHSIPLSLSDTLMSLHRLNANFIYVIVGVHIAAILFYWLYKRQDLVSPMISGDAEADASEASASDARDDRGVRVLAFVLIVLAAIAVWALTTFPPGAGPSAS